MYIPVILLHPFTGSFYTEIIQLNTKFLCSAQRMGIPGKILCSTLNSVFTAPIKCRFWAKAAAIPQILRGISKSALFLEHLKSVEKHFDEDKYFDLRKIVPIFFGLPPQLQVQGQQMSKHCKGGWRLSYGLSSPPSKFMHTFSFVKSNKIMLLVFHGFLGINWQMPSFHWHHWLPQLIWYRVVLSLLSVGSIRSVILKTSGWREC